MLFNSIRNTMNSQTRAPRQARLRLQSLEERSLLTVGGGFTGGGILGEYFSNADLEGDAAFVRRDVRVDFAWGDNAPGGSNSASVKSVGADFFSVRWTGTVIPRFTETYTFHVVSEDGMRLWVRPAGDANSWTLLVDTWETPSAEPATGDLSVRGGQKYEVKFETRELEGAAGAQLRWSSPRTEMEVIDTAANVGVNAVTYDFYVYADIAKSGQIGWGDPIDYFGRPKVSTDELGWPVADAGHMFWSNQDPSKMGGTYLLRFVGQAQVSGWMGRGRFMVDDVDYGSILPLGIGYDPLTNTTTAELVIQGTDLFGLSFTETRRLPEDIEPTGVTNVQLMRPTSPNSDVHYSPDEIFDTNLKDAYARYTTLRYLTANFNKEREWSERKLPDAMQTSYADRAAVWEYEIMLANETGKDLYITIPVLASQDYIQNLALLLRYGSDGIAPYTESVVDGRYPGLNPNLRVYVEWGNEVWNWSFSQGGWAGDEGRAAVLNGTPDGLIVNFDGQRPNGDFRRWAALKTVQTSNIFRSVWGDDAMGSRVRVVYEYQYNNVQSTAVNALKFIDQYFNNGDGNQNVAEPHPVSYYIWGAGGAAYFSAGNPRGLITNMFVPNGMFEGLVGGPGGTATPRPPGYAMKFQGDSGLYRNLAGVPANGAMNIPNVGKLPATPFGKQAIYISGTGSIEVSINFTKAGVYAIDFQAASELGPDLGNTLDFYLGDQRITPNGRELTVPTHAWWPGNGHRDAGKFSTYGTVPFEITKPGKYTFRIVGSGAEHRTTVLDDLRVASLDAIYKSRLPTGVNAAGVDSLNTFQAQISLQSSYVEAYGLNVVSYEGGWSLGGDMQAVPLQSWAKYRDARTIAVMAQTIDSFHKAGGDVYILGVYDQWYLNDYANADDYPIVKGIDAGLENLPSLHTTTTVINTKSPIVLGPGRATKSLTTPTAAAAGDWMSWTVEVKTPGEYRIFASAAPDGFASVSVDGQEIGRSSSGMKPGGTIRLETGVHTIRVQSIGGAFAIHSITLDWLSDSLVP